MPHRRKCCCKTSTNAVKGLALRLLVRFVEQAGGSNGKIKRHRSKLRLLYYKYEGRLDNQYTFQQRYRFRTLKKVETYFTPTAKDYVDHKEAAFGYGQRFQQLL